MIQYGVVAHGGVGSPGTFSDGCRNACASAWKILESGESALDAVVGATCVLEDDGRFNAGSGSVPRLDGKTREMPPRLEQLRKDAAPPEHRPPSSLAALGEDHDFLLEGDVFTKDAIEMWINYKRTKEVDALRLRPHPYEFFLYYDI